MHTVSERLSSTQKLVMFWAQVWIATAHGPYQDGRVWLLKPKDYNDGIGNGEGNDPLLILAAADISGGDAAAAGKVYLGLWAAHSAAKCPFQTSNGNFASFESYGNI